MAVKLGAAFTVLVMVLVAVVGAVLFLARRPDRTVARHVHDEAELTGAERHERPPTP